MADCCSVDEEASPSSPQAPMASSLPPPAFDNSLTPVGQSFVVGYTCTFVEPPKELRTDCPICLYILREPYQATCCGSIYCKSCIERVKRDLKPCPACRSHDFNIFPDRGLRNSLYNFRVLCLHKDSGCTWTNELRYLDEHLNANPKPEHRFFGCEHAKQPCSLCDQVFARGELENHENKKCLKRAYTCEYCADYEGTFEEVAKNHWPQCPDREVQCPNDCGVYPLQKNLDEHLRRECELRKPEPELTSPDGVQRYVDEAIKKQLPIFAAEFLKKALKDEISKEMNQLGEIQEAITGLKELKTESQKLRTELEELRLSYAEDQKRIDILKTHFSIVPITFTLDGYKSRHLRRDMGWTSPPFYTHPRGYRMCLLIDIGGPGGQPKGTYMSVYLNLTRGEYDGFLKWPFRGSVTVSMLSSKEEKAHHIEIIKYHDSTPIATSGRVFTDEKMSKPWGKGKFIKHVDLEPGGFVVNDKLQFEISKVEIDC